MLSSLSHRGERSALPSFTSIGTVTCTLYGYPGVSLVGGHPVTQIGAAADGNPGTPRHLVTLAPGAVANALLRIEHAQILPASQCDPVNATYLQIFPPNQSTPVYPAYSATACAIRSDCGFTGMTVTEVMPAPKATAANSGQRRVSERRSATVISWPVIRHSCHGPVVASGATSAMPDNHDTSIHSQLVARPHL